MNSGVKEFIINIVFFTLWFTMGYYVRGYVKQQEFKQEVKEETIRRIAYALQSGMLTVNHDKIVEIAKLNQKTMIKKQSEVIAPQSDTNQATIKNKDNIEDIDSNIICTPTNESKIKLPEEG